MPPRGVYFNAMHLYSCKKEFTICELNHKQRFKVTMTPRYNRVVTTLLSLMDQVGLRVRKLYERDSWAIDVDIPAGAKLIELTPKQPAAPGGSRSCRFQ